MALNDISLTAGMRSNLLSLQNSVKLLDRTQERLSSGKKVNTAIDNPVSYFAAQSLNSRASVIDSLKDAMGQAVQTVKAADKGITAITAMIEQAKGIAQEALSVEPTTTPAPVSGQATLSTQWATATVELDGPAANAQITVGGETFVFTDAGGANDFEDAAELAAAINEALEGEGYVATESGGVVTITRTEDDVESITAAAGFTVNEIAHEETMTFSVGGTAYNGTGATAAEAATALQTQLGTIDGATATVSPAGAVNVTFEAQANGEFTALVDRYNEIRNQLDTIALDSGYKGKNLLNRAVMTVKFEGSHTLEVQGFDASTSTDGLNIGLAEWSEETDIDASINQLDAAATKLRSEASKLSGNLSIITVRQDFSDNMINTLTEGADKLTLADANEEGANMLMLQTRQSLSTTALSLSAQAAQSVLRLFQ